MIKRVCIYLIGLVVLCLGVVLNTKTNLGVAAINVTPFVLSKTTTISLGTAVFIMYCLFILCQCILKQKIELLTILQLPVSLLFGKMVDLFNTLLNFEASNIVTGLIMLLIAIILVAFGTTLVISQNLVPNAPDGFVNTIGEKTNKQFGYVKLRFDIVCVCIAFILSLILSGKIIGIGIGTIISMLLTGNMCTFFKKIIIKN